jgi:hypothetical protein
MDARLDGAAASPPDGLDRLRAIFGDRVEGPAGNSTFAALSQGEANAAKSLISRPTSNLRLYH